MSDRVCSNCGAVCGVDSRMGSVDHYLVCKCASAENTHWIDDGRGGYHVYLNNASPIPVEEYHSKNKKTFTTITVVVKEESSDQNWSREDD